MILCDIGNTTFHFLVDGTHTRYYLSERLPKFENKEIYFVSVNEKATKKFIKNYPTSKNIEEILKFQTTYSGMGIDRKVACYKQKSCVIVDAGSAITVDMMGKKKHKGGFILPGLKSFQNSFKLISKKLDFSFVIKQKLDKMPQSTREAITYATIKAIILPIKEISKGKKLIFTGGDGEILSRFFKHSLYKEDLIFENMKRIIDANSCPTKR